MARSLQLFSYKGVSEPWKTLAEAAYNSFHGHDISTIQIPSGEHLQGLRRIYYEKAVSLLLRANLSHMDYYALFTALSGIVDLRTAHAADVSGYHVQAPELLTVDPKLTSLFQDLDRHLAQGLEVLSDVCIKWALKVFDSQQGPWGTDSDRTSPPPQSPQRILKVPVTDSPILASPTSESPLLGRLSNLAFEENFRNSDKEQGKLRFASSDMFMNTRDMNEPSDGGGMDIDASGGEGEEVGGQYRTYLPVIELVRYLASSIQQGEFSKTKVSITNHWKTCLECLSDNRLDLRIGNDSAALNATLIRLHGHLAEHEINFVRADDLVMVVDGLEVLIITVHETESEFVREALYFENLRLNKAVELAATLKGVSLRKMYSLNILGMSAMVCALHKMEGHGYLGGLGYNFLICIPESEKGMVDFLNCEAPQLLWNYTNLLLDYQDDVRQILTSVRNRANDA